MLPLVYDVCIVVDKAIEMIQVSGIRCEVGLANTTLEGNDLNQLIEVTKSAYRSCFKADAESEATSFKIVDAMLGTLIKQRVGKYREVKL